jgi:hypothetical protein
MPNEAILEMCITHYDIYIFIRVIPRYAVHFGVKKCIFISMSLTLYGICGFFFHCHIKYNFFFSL